MRPVYHSSRVDTKQINNFSTKSITYDNVTKSLLHKFAIIPTRPSFQTYQTRYQGRPLNQQPSVSYSVSVAMSCLIFGEVRPGELVGWDEPVLLAGRSHALWPVVAARCTGQFVGTFEPPDRFHNGYDTWVSRRRVSHVYLGYFGGDNSARASGWSFCSSDWYLGLDGDWMTRGHCSIECTFSISVVDGGHLYDRNHSNRGCTQSGLATSSNCGPYPCLAHRSSCHTRLRLTLCLMRGGLAPFPNFGLYPCLAHPSSCHVRLHLTLCWLRGALAPFSNWGLYLPCLAHLCFCHVRLRLTLCLLRDGSVHHLDRSRWYCVRDAFAAIDRAHIGNHIVLRKSLGKL